MRELTELEMLVGYKAWDDYRNGILGNGDVYSFKAGFAAGLDHAAGQGDHQRLEIAKQVEELQAERDEARAMVDRLRAELLQTRRELTGWARAWQKEANGDYCRTYNRERGKALDRAAKDIMRLVKGLRLCAIFGR